MAELDLMAGIGVWAVFQVLWWRFGWRVITAR